MGRKTMLANRLLFANDCDRMHLKECASSALEI